MKDDSTPGERISIPLIIALLAVMLGAMTYGLMQTHKQVRSIQTLLEEQSQKHESLVQALSERSKGENAAWASSKQLVDVVQAQGQAIRLLQSRIRKLEKASEATAKTPTAKTARRIDDRITDLLFPFHQNQVEEMLFLQPPSLWGLPVGSFVPCRDDPSCWWGFPIH